MDTDKSLQNQSYLLKGSYPAALLPIEQERMFPISFMLYARKVPAKKAKMKTFYGLFKHLWSTFKNLLATYSRMDIVFDL